MRVLFCASECAPLIKTGGLADVVGSLPRALAEEGVDTRVLLPAYPEVLDRLAKVRRRGRWTLFGGKARIATGRTEDGVAVWALDAPHLFGDGGNPYLTADGRDRPDSHRRFGALSQLGARLAIDGLGAWRPDICHAHDWQTGLVPTYLRQAGSSVPSVFTIHNMAFQGVFPAAVRDELDLDPDGFTVDGYEYYGHVGFLKAALAQADRITTVSPSYARELAGPEFGMGLDGVIRARGAHLSGIVNGIDTRVWDPETDPAVASGFSRRAPAGKKRCRADLERYFGLPPAPDRPLFAVISRLTRQKGLDLLLDQVPALVARGGRLVLLGTGETELENGFRVAAGHHPDAVRVSIGYDEALAHRIQAGADALLVPSRFEPCGLTQLCAMRYGTIPVVSRTGGLADTVIDANPAALAAGCATGVQFAPVDGAGLAAALERTRALYADRATWRRMVRNALSQPVGWEVSARAYRDLYRSLLPDGAGR